MDFRGVGFDGFFRVNRDRERLVIYFEIFGKVFDLPPVGASTRADRFPEHPHFVIGQERPVWQTAQQRVEIQPILKSFQLKK